jgi:hypothetical protein
VYALLILLNLGVMSGKILSVAGFNGDNDKSRWATIRALVDHHTYVIGLRIYFDERGEKFQDQMQQPTERWDTIDKVLAPEISWRNDNPQPGRPLFAKNFYSSKPPILATVLAGEYWLLRELFGWQITSDDRQTIMRCMLWFTYALPWTIALVLAARLIEQFGTTDLGRSAAMAELCFCTFFNAFAVTLNNHLIAMWAVVFAVYPVLSTELGMRNTVPRIPHSALHAGFVGFWAGWAAVVELPAFAFVALLFLWVLIRRPRNVPPFLLGISIPLAGFLITNYLAIGTIMPAYEKFGTEWYRYSDSHWLNPQGLDASTDTLAIYLFHLTFGHHGIFSLTPVFLLSWIAMIFPGGTALPVPDEPGAPPATGNAVAQEHAAKLRCVLGWGTLFLSLIVIGFYLSKTDSYNYGGWTSGPRWFFWLMPLWLLASLPILDRLSRSRIGRGLIYVTIALSAMSVAYVGMNPWSHPWLYRFLEYFGWIRY